MDIDHGTITIGKESIGIVQTENEVWLRHSELETLIEEYKKYKEQLSKPIQLSKRVNPDAPGNVSYLYA